MPPDFPLYGVKVVEFAGLAPGPFCGLILADWGASVIRIDRSDQAVSSDFLARGKRSLAINLKLKDGLEIVKKLLAEADVLIDPFRPGVLEKLGLGPKVFLGRDGLNKKLIYTRIVGFAPGGHHKDMAGHDLNYLAISGLLSMMPPSNEEGCPSFPLNILADFAGGGLVAANGVLLAMLERCRSGLGQVVESDMVAGARYVSSFPLIHKFVHSPLFAQDTGSNPLDGGAPYYGVYRCRDGKWFTVAALEPQFYKIFLTKFLACLPYTHDVPGLKSGSTWVPRPDNQFDQEEWPDLRTFLKAGFLTKTRDEWTAVFDGRDACAVPVLTPFEAVAHTVASSPIPQPHPHLSRTPARNSAPNGENARSSAMSLNIQPGTHNEEILTELGLSMKEKLVLVQHGVIPRNTIVKAAL
ncbi:CoA-transferase family III domain-containing protein [Hysterangium stoloniferum]|nr:CoA-transferase family III domain-containing protein [Hysterangium stoloniferum]